MPCYLGIPVCIEEAFRIFGLNIQMIENDIINKYNEKKSKYDCDKTTVSLWELIISINKYFKTYFIEIKIFTTDKGQCIIGYEVEEPTDLWNKFINVDDFIVLILNLKKKFAKEMELLNANLSEVTLEYMEGNKETPEKVKNPIPYVIYCSY